jgi:hypothetical protein
MLVPAIPRAAPADRPAKTARKSTHLDAHHELLESVAAEILAGVVAGDFERVPAAVTLLQTKLEAHLRDEERDLIPQYAAHDPEDAARILAEHAGIRKALADLDVECDLHLVRADAMRAFLAAIEAHAAHERAGLYEWAERSPGPATLTTAIHHTKETK